MTLLARLTKVVVLVLFCVSARAETLFEGYYRLSVGSVPIGYMIQRYALDPKNKTFESVSYLYTKTDEAVTVESLSAKSTSKLEPLSYQYSQLEGKKTKAIDALVKGKKMILKTIENGKVRTREVPITDDTFFSTFLSYLMLKHPKGVQVGNKFDYKAVAEEEGTVENGVAFVKEQVKEKGQDSFRILNTFKKQEFVNWANTKGETLKTKVPEIDMTAELVSDPQDAYKNMDFNQSSIKLLFGEIPEGKINMLHKK